MEKEVPPEFAHLLSEESIPWERIAKQARKNAKKGAKPFAAFTDGAISLASNASMKKDPDPALIILGMEACLARGRMLDALFLSSESQNPSILSLRAIALFAISEVDGLRDTLQIMEAKIGEDATPEDQVRLYTVKILLAVAERDTSVIQAVMEFDMLLETHPDQVEDPLTETLFTLYVVATLLYEVGQISKSIRLIDTLENMARVKNHRSTLLLVENLRGNISNLQGDVRRAESHYIRVKEMGEILENKLSMAMALNNLGTIMLHTLKFEEALETFKTAFDLMEFDAAKEASLANMGEITTLLGRYEEAEEYLKHGIRLEEKTHRGHVEPYAWYAILLSKTNRKAEARKYLKKAKYLADSSEKPLSKGIYLYAKAVIEATENRLKKAASSLEKAVKLGKENSIFELVIRAKLELTRTHIQMYQAKKSEEEYAHAAYHLDDLIQIAKEQGHGSLYAEALLLRSDVCRLAGKKKEAKGDLEKVLSIASFEGGKRLEMEAKERLKSLSTPTQYELDKTVLKDMERISGFKSLGPIKEIPKPTLNALIALNKDSGLPEFVHYFDSQLKVDSTMVSGFITAVAAFGSEIMGQRGLLRSINHEGFTLLMEHTETRIVTLVASEETFDVRFRLHEFAEEYEGKFPPSEGKKGIVPGEYKEAHKLIDDIFGTVV